MVVMKPYFPPLEDESLVSWLSRFAMFHCNLSLAEFLKFTGLSQQDLMIGKEAVFVELSEISGVPIQHLKRHSHFRLSDRLFEYRGEEFFREFMVRNRVTFCPACLLSSLDDSRGGLKTELGRINWLFSPVRTCSVHNVPLVRLPGPKGCVNFLDVAHLASDQRNLEDLLQGSKTRRPSGLQTYVERRLDGLSVVSWMDNQQIDLGCRAAEMLGACAEFGAHVALSKLTEDDWDRAGKIGYEFTAQGDDGIREGLDYIFGKPHKNIYKSGPQGMFGKLYQWVQFRKNDKPIGPFKNVFREFILDKLPLDPGTVLFDEIVEQTRRHSVSSLSSKYSVHFKTVAHALQKSGLLTVSEDQKNERHTVPARSVESLIEKLARAVPVAKIPKYIGCSRTHAQLLLTSGLLNQVIPDDDNTSGRHKGVDSRDLDGLIEGMRQFGKPVEQPSIGMADVGGAAQALNESSMKIVGLLLDQELENVELLDPDLKFRSVLVNIQEVARKLGAQTGKAGVTISNAAREMAISTGAVQFLVDARDSEGQSALKTCGQYRHMGIMRDLIDPESLEVFRGQYRKLSEINGYWAPDPDRLRTELANKGIRPAWDPEIAGVEFYLTSLL